MWPDPEVAELVEHTFVPVRFHIKSNPDGFRRFNAQWTPTQIILGQDLPYTITVTNTTTDVISTDGVVTDTIPANTTFVSAPGCINAAGTLTCNVGVLAPRASRTFNVVVHPTPGARSLQGATALASIALQAR